MAVMPGLTKVLRGHPSGQWVVLDEGMGKVIASEALIRAMSLRKTRGGAGEPILMRVPNPSMTCIYVEGDSSVREASWARRVP